jgi:Stage II sporulation protein E (SpoIIE)
VLVAFSDGLTEALNASGEEFGEERLLSCIESNCGLRPAALVQCLLDMVQQFTAGAAQSDAYGLGAALIRRPSSCSLETMSSTYDPFKLPTPRGCYYFVCDRPGVCSFLSIVQT